MRKLSMFFMILAIGLLFVSCATLPIDGDGNGDEITNQELMEILASMLSTNGMTLGMRNLTMTFK